MAAINEPLPPLLPVIPEYTSWTDHVQDNVARDTVAADASFAARHGAMQAGQASGRADAASPEEARGALADQTA